jgi:hypothetical protein
MKDTKNLIKKRDVVIPKLIKEAHIKGDEQAASYWKHELKAVSDKIDSRKINKIKNIKQFKKSN